MSMMDYHKQCKARVAELEAKLTDCENDFINDRRKYSERIAELEEAIEVADRRFEDIAQRKGGPAWYDAKIMLHSDLSLIHDGLLEVLTARDDEMSERDKYLTKQMSECWHDLNFSTNSMSKCSKCGVMYSCSKSNFNDFSTWQGFGKLAEFVGSKFDDIEIARQLFERAWPYYDSKFPDRFANAVYGYLKEIK